MPRRNQANRNTRNLFKIANGNSYAIRLPIETLRAWGWEPGQQCKLTIDDKTQRITIEAKR